MTRDLHEEVTNKIIAQMEKGTAPWQKQWDAHSNFSLPINATTNKSYQGINIPLLWFAAEENGFDTQEWASFKQWSAQKEKIKKGAKGTTIIYYDVIERPDGDDIKKIPFIKASYVFNRCQLEGYILKQREAKNTIERNENAERFFSACGEIYHHDGGNRAFYSRVTDDIHLPNPDTFISSEAYYSVKGHETIHYTWKPDRCNRQLGKRFGDQEYAAEELVAEMGAAFLCAKLDISKEPREDHACYLANWLEVLKNDKKAIFTAASEASKAVEYLDKCQP